MDRSLKAALASPRVGFPCVALIPIVAFGASLALSAATNPSPDEVTCGGGVLGNRVKAQFDVPQGRAVADRLSDGPELPDLENDRPARVLVFDDPFTFFRAARSTPGSSVSSRTAFSFSTMACR